VDIAIHSGTTSYTHKHRGIMKLNRTSWGTKNAVKISNGSLSDHRKRPTDQETPQVSSQSEIRMHMFMSCKGVHC